VYCRFCCSARFLEALADYHTMIDVGGLYWHFINIIALLGSLRSASGEAFLRLRFSWKSAFLVTMMVTLRPWNTWFRGKRVRLHLLAGRVLSQLEFPRFEY